MKMSSLIRRDETISLLYEWFDLVPDLTYQKISLFERKWIPDTDLSQMIVIGAPYGGPMAIVRDPKQFIEVGGSAKPIIRIFTASGQWLGSINWNNGGNLLTMGWSDAEKLLCIQDDGRVFIYNMFGSHEHTFSMGQEAKDMKIVDAKIFASNSGTGIAVMTTNFRIFLINSIKEPKNRQLPEMPKSILDPSCWTIINEDRNTCSLVARQHELFKLTQGYSVCTMQSVTFDNKFKSIIIMSVSYNNRFLALYTDSGVVWMGTTSLEKKCEFNTNRTEKPTQIEWILDSENYSKPDGDAIVIAYPTRLMIVSVAGECSEHSYDSVPFLIPEMDCVRIVSSSDGHELLRKVPNCVKNIFKIYSQKPSAYLFYAFEKYEAKSHQSDEYLGLIKGKVDDAVNECIEAASHEFNTNTQKSLIRAAYFGKAFVPQHNPDKYIETCRILRVLNALRDPKIGIPLTYVQFNRLKPYVVLDRLVFRKHYALAIQIAKHLKLPESRILEHWAFHKVTYDENDDDVARKISDKLKMAGTQGISFCNIAKKAQERGRKNLAIKLLEMESKSSLQVPLLLTLGESKKALMSATKSGDTNLIYTVLLQLKETTQLADFQMIIRIFPTAHNLYKKYCHLNSKSALQEIFNQEDDFVAQAEFALQEGISNRNIESSLVTTSSAYKKAHKDVEAELCEDARKLLKEQKTFDDRYTIAQTQTFVGLSVHETIKRLLILGDLKNAEKKRNEYKVPDKRFWWLRIQVLSDGFQWDELDKFAKSKKSPIGYEPFVEVCLKKNNIEEAKKYLPKCRNDKKVKWYIRAGLATEAAHTCYEQRDIHGLHLIHTSAKNNNDRALLTKVEQYITKLSDKR